MRHLIRSAGTRRAAAALAASALVLATAVTPAGASTSTEIGALTGVHQVESATYTLGDKAFRVPGFLNSEGTGPADLELTGVVHYPKDLAEGRYPVVLLSHGSWITCADRSAYRQQAAATAALEHTTDPAEIERLEGIIDRGWAAMTAWPCAAGTPPLPSYRGYDYLGRTLAAQGFIVVSISANGVNAGEMGEAQDHARAALINKHLAMWQQLASRGNGPLAGRFTDASTGHARRIDFRGHADLTTVGLMGHSRGGRGTVFQSADVHQAQWPAGVRIKAVVPLAAAEHYTPDDNPDNPENTPYRITNLPVGGVAGSCDGAVGGRYFDFLNVRNRAPLYEFFVHGANHNYFNTQWSPSSGQVGAEDDAPRTGQTAPGRCVTPADREHTDRQLTESQQRLVAVTYLSAFFRRYLLGDRTVDPVLTGRFQPLRPITRIEVLTDLP